MKQPLSGNGVLLSVFVAFAILQSDSPKVNIDKPNPRIQVAILLDVSNSMDGLIEQAKGQLWNMVKILSRAKCDETRPAIEIALYEYGRPDNGEANGYIRQISGFTNDLDLLSGQLYSLSTNGGSEYCGNVIYNSLHQLPWDNASATYKVIFIAGNEDFLQGPISYLKACEEAKKKGVIVNTIYCGSEAGGIAEKWNLCSECSNGSFSVIDQDARDISIPTPYDSTIFLMKSKLNKTYIAYGPLGKTKVMSMVEADTLAVYNLVDPTKVTNYVIVKSDNLLNFSPEWDLIDAYKKDNRIIDSVDIQTLSDSLKNKSRKELRQLVIAKTGERDQVRKEIADLSKTREAFIAAEKAKKNEKGPETLEMVMERILREQTKRFNMKIE